MKREGQEMPQVSPGLVLFLMLEQRIHVASKL